MSSSKIRILFIEKVFRYINNASNENMFLKFTIFIFYNPAVTSDGITNSMDMGLGELQELVMRPGVLWFMGSQRVGHD